MSEDRLCEVRYLTVVDYKLQVCPRTYTLYSNVLGHHQLHIVLLKCRVNTGKIYVTVVDDRIVILYIKILVCFDIEFRLAEFLNINDSLCLIDAQKVGTKLIDENLSVTNLLDTLENTQN